MVPERGHRALSNIACSPNHYPIARKLYFTQHKLSSGHKREYTRKFTFGDPYNPLQFAAGRYPFAMASSFVANQILFASEIRFAPEHVGK